MQSLVPRMKSAALRATTSSGLANLFRPLQGGAAVVFMLHRFVDPARGVRGYDPASVRELLAYLRRAKHKLVSLDALFASLRGEQPPLRDAVAFTIDDGYAEQAEIASPLFAEFDCPVTTFVTTGFLDRALWFWWDQIQYIFRQTTRRTLKLDLGHAMLQYDIGDSAGGSFAEEDFTNRCKAVPEHRKRDAIGRLSHVAEVDLPHEPPAAYAPMTWGQLREAERRGMTFAPHTVTHPILARTDDDQCRAEIVDSWSRLQSEAARPVPILAYPNGQPGDFGEREIEVLRSTDLKGAVTSVAGFATSPRHRARNGPFTVPRFPFPDSLPYLVQQVSGIERLKFMLRGEH
jgi:peptidoglycan/xylan/chitin deacetylase (PgdA/CDA1 family)